MTRARLVLVGVAIVSLGVSGLAHAAQGDRWHEVGATRVPFYYNQGVTHDENGNRYFSSNDSLFRTNPALSETARKEVVIPREVTQAEGYNHIGDISYLAGKLLLPLECYYGPAENTCGTGAFAVVDATTLQWSHYVKLNPAYIPKAMWVEVTPDGQLLWTSSGNDLLAYRTSDVLTPPGHLLDPVLRLVGWVPPSGVTGATFIGDRLFLAGGGNGHQVWSVSLVDGSRRLEIGASSWQGESEGLDDDEGLSRRADQIAGELHWLVAPFEGQPPTYGPDSAVVHYDRQR